MYISRGVRLNLKKKMYFLPEDTFFTLTNSEDPDEISIMLHFICVFTVCKSTRFRGVSQIQRVKSFQCTNRDNLCRFITVHYYYTRNGGLSELES